MSPDTSAIASGTIQSFLSRITTTTWLCLLASVMVPVWILSPLGPDYPKVPQGLLELKTARLLNQAGKSAAQALELPYQFQPKPGEASFARLALQLPSNQANSGQAICVTRWTSHGEVWIRGERISAPARTSSGIPNGTWGAHYIFLPEGFQGPIDFELVASTGRPVGLWPIWIGPSEVVREACSRLEMRKRFLAGGAGLVMLTFALLLMAFSYQQKERLSLWLGVGSFFATARGLFFGLPDPPLNLETWTMLYFCFRLSYAPFWFVFIDRVVNKDSPWNRVYWVFGLQIAFSLSFVFASPYYWHHILQVQGSLYMVLGILYCWLLLRWRAQDATLRSMKIVLLLSFSAHFPDYYRWLTEGEFHLSAIALTTMPLLFITLIVSLIQRQARDLSKAEVLTTELRAKVLEQALLLAEVKRTELLAGERRRIMREMHDGVGSHLVGAASLLTKKNQEGLALEMVERALLEMRNTVDATANESESLDALFGSFRHRIEPVLKAKNIHLDYELDDLEVGLRIKDPEQRLNLLRVLQEAMVNVIRHSGAKQVRLEVSSEGRNLTVIVQDDGQGFVPHEQTKGHGLKNISERVTKLNGVLTVRSEGRGTILRFSFPLPVDS